MIPAAMLAMSCSAPQQNSLEMAVDTLRVPAAVEYSADLIERLNDVNTHCNEIPGGYTGFHFLGDSTHVTGLLASRASGTDRPPHYGIPGYVLFGETPNTDGCNPEK